MNNMVGTVNDMETLSNADDVMSTIYHEFARELAEIGDEVNAQFTDELNSMDPMLDWTSDTVHNGNQISRLTALAAILQAHRPQPSTMSWISNQGPVRWSFVAGIATVTVVTLLLFGRR